MKAAESKNLFSVLTGASWEESIRRCRTGRNLVREKIAKKIAEMRKSGSVIAIIRP